ncbi:MAG: hypothetical protein M0Q22_05350 [Sulfuritalea sp.]|jgi:hypothetical protein|nr:hypothetical protein [Sulfuritalea sp.]
MKAITVTAPSGILSNALLHIVQGLEQLGIDVLTDIDFRPGRPDGSDNEGGLNIFPPYSVLKPTRFRKGEDLSHGPLFIDLTFGNPSDWGALTAELAVRPVIFFNMNDNCTLMDYPPQWIVFSANHSKHAHKGGRLFPFSLGISADLLAVIEDRSLLTRPRNGKILRNFRPSGNQNVRDMLDLSLVPRLSKFFTVDRSFGSGLDGYLDSMSSSSAVLAYGGQLVFDYFDSDPDAGLEQATQQSPRETKHCRFQHFRGPVEILRWDGWRFYEACAFGCCPFQLDFEKYGFALPKPPVPWKEYIPIDLEDVSFLPLRLANEIGNRPDLFSTIGSAAQKWLIDNASPVSLARFVLDTIVDVANSTLADQAS